MRLDIPATERATLQRCTRRAFLKTSGSLLTAATMPVRARTETLILQPDAMQSDIVLLRRAYETLHPGLYRYSTPREMEMRWAALANAASTPTSLQSFYLSLSRFLATIRCGHTYANFYNQKSEVAAALFDTPDRLPFNFLWLHNAMIVTVDPFDTGITPGSRIVSIDDRPAAEILASLMPLARADGHNDAKRRRLLSVQGDDRYETFDVFFSLMFGRDRYRLVVVDPTGRRRNAVVDAVSLEARRAHAHAGVDASGDAPVWSIARRGDAAILTMPNWGLYNSKWDWRGWLDEAIDKLVADRVPRLVVDLRANEGGLDCGNVLAARLVKRETPFEQVHRLVRYRIVPDDLKPHLDTWDHTFDRLGENAVQVDERFYRLDGKGDRVEPILPSGKRYMGDVRVLIGPQNSSATFQFAEFVQRNRLATLIGTTTGGNRRGINGGCFYFLRLPATGLEADLPLIGRFPVAAQPDEGIKPDVTVPVTRVDIAQGLDRQLAQALRNRIS